MGKTRTFYTVRYFNGNCLTTKIFENKEKALEFAKGDYCDMPKRHTVSNQRTIENFEKWLENQNAEETMDN